MSIVLLAGTAIIKNKKILLVQQKPDGDQASKWGPPAGHGEFSESPLETAIRETKEETGLDVKIKGVVQSGVFNYKNKDYALVFYACSPKKGQEIKIQDEEVANYTWASLDDIKKDKYPMRKEFLKIPLLRALTQKPLPMDSFLVFEVE